MGNATDDRRQREEQPKARGTSRPPLTEQRPLLPRGVEYLICFLVVGVLVLWLYGVLLLAKNRIAEGIYCIGGAAVAFIVLFFITRRNIEMRRRGPRVF